MTTHAENIKSATQKRVTVNNVELDQNTLQQLERTYQTQLQSGDFWYDAVSGLWGVRGGPAFGQILPGLKLGGPLQFTASGGQTNIVINGRAIHPLEYQNIIATYGYAVPGRYWMDATGNLGIEGGPFLFNVNQAAMKQSGKSWYHGNANTGNYIASDGNCISFQSRDGGAMSGC